MLESGDPQSNRRKHVACDEGWFTWRLRHRAKHKVCKAKRLILKLADVDDLPNGEARYTFQKDGGDFIRF